MQRSSDERVAERSSDEHVEQWHIEIASMHGHAVCGIQPVACHRRQLCSFADLYMSGIKDTKNKVCEMRQPHAIFGGARSKTHLIVIILRSRQ